MPDVIAEYYGWASIINKTNMITKTIPTPIRINLYFLLLLILPLLVMYGVGKASASPINSYCSRQFNLSFFQSISPRAERVCRVEFKRITDEWKTGLYTNNK